MIALVRPSLMVPAAYAFPHRLVANDREAGKPWERAFGSVIDVHEGHQAFGAHAMPSRRKRIEPTDWRFSMEQIGRELGKIYRQPKRLPQRLRAVAIRT
jgi:hypothetical protein